MRAMPMVRRDRSFAPRHSTPRHHPYQQVPRSFGEVPHPATTTLNQSASPSFMAMPGDQSNNIKQENVDSANFDPEHSNSSSSVANENSGGNSTVQGDTEVTSIKQELTDSELDLEITGVELGAPISSQENWASNIAMGMTMDQSGAMGSQADMSGQEGFSKYSFSTFF